MLRCRLISALPNSQTVRERTTNSGRAEQVLKCHDIPPMIHMAPDTIQNERRSSNSRKTATLSIDVSGVSEQLAAPQSGSHSYLQRRQYPRTADSSPDSRPALPCSGKTPQRRHPRAADPSTAPPSVLHVWRGRADPRSEQPPPSQPPAAGPRAATLGPLYPIN